MASVKRMPGSAYWYACYRGVDGTRKQESTKLTVREDALSLAIAYEQAATAARDKQWSEERAQKFLAQCRAASGVSQGSEVVGVGTWLGKWAEKTGGRLKPKSARKYRDVIESFVAFLGPRSKGMLAGVRHLDVASWRDDMIARGRTAKTANVALGILSQAFREAKVLHLVHLNPCEGLKLRNADGGNTRRRPLTEAQFEQVLRVVDGEWRTFILLLGLTGARQQEAAQLRWDQVDLERELLTLIRGKQRDKPHVVPMHPRVKAALDAAHKGAGSIFLLPTIAAKNGKALSAHFRRTILPKIGIVQPYGGRPGGKVPAQYSLHSLRHSLSSWIDAAGATAAQRRDMLGHESAAINERYTHTNLEAVRAVLARVAPA